MFPSMSDYYKKKLSELLLLFQLELNGMGIEEGTDAGADPLFLMELMEINQALDEARSKEESAKIGASMKGLG